jgi:DNA polymerase III alpha subunit
VGRVTELKGRKRDKFGQVVFDGEGLFDLLYSGNTHIGGLPADKDDETVTFNKISKVYDRADDRVEFYESPDITVEEFDEILINSWMMPQEYKDINLWEYLSPKCNTQAELERLAAELVEFDNRHLNNLLRFMIYFVDTMRQHKIVWGVGRGSSVASYTLYLIGVNKINPIKFGITVDEFLK